MTRRRVALLMLLAASMVGCFEQSEEYRPKFVVVFVDISGSVKDVGTYRDAWLRVLASLEPGDRVLLAGISDETFTRFRPAADVEVPEFAWTKENKLVHEKKVGEANAKLRTAFDQLLRGVKAPHTRVLDTFVLAGKVFDDDPRRHVLVVLSDMMEDSREYNFEKTQITDVFADRVIKQVRERNRLPNLKSVTVYVAGASAPTEERAAEVERFWMRYLGACGAGITNSRYGPALVSFAK